MTNNKRHTLKLLPALIASLAMGVSASSYAGTDEGGATQTNPEITNPKIEKTEEVRLIVLREGKDNEVIWDLVTVPANELEARKAEILSDPRVISVEEDAPVHIPTPPKTDKPSDNEVQAQAFSSSWQRPSALYNDTLYSEQLVFDPAYKWDLQLEEPLRRLSFENTVRVGVIDGGFVRSFDLDYADGASLGYYGDSTFNDNVGPNFITGDPDVGCPYVDQFGETPSLHGYHVSQVIGAKADNNLGIAGVTRNVEVIAARALGCAGRGAISQSIKAILWLSGAPIEGLDTLTEPAHIINLSLGGPGACSQAEQHAINYANSKGTIVVVAAGNDDMDVANWAPANCDGVITVASSRPSGAKAPSSNWGSKIDIAAQGFNVTGADPDGITKIRLNGTSFASPAIAGVIASVLSERPNLTLEQIKHMLSISGKPLLAPENGVRVGTGAGLLDVMKFLDAAGIPREILGTQPALAGERERYTEALTHPAAKSFLSAELDGADACSLAEVDSRAMENARSEDPFVVFSVPAGKPLDPSISQATILKQTAGDRMTISTLLLDNPSFEYGLARCDIASGNNCNQIDTIRGFSLDSLEQPEVCSIDQSQLAAM